jgi:hypothetical protein
MMPTDNDQTGPTWEQFSSKHKWGNKGKGYRQEPKKEKKQRLKGMQHNSKKKKKKKPIQQLQQLAINGENITLDDSKAFADIMKTKPANTIRIALQNIQLLPENARHYKSRQLINHIRQSEVDAFMMNEV